MTSRAVLTVILILLCAPALAASPRIRPTVGLPPPPPMLFYVAKGAPDSCGRGCDSWIVAEGKIDAGAAGRFRKFLQKVRDRNLPIYFSSPGGNLDQGLAMGAMLRERPTVARVARTVAMECGFESQDSDVCVKLKQSGLQLRGDLRTLGAMCNSACPYVMLGAATREVSPDAILAVHSPKVILHYSGDIKPSAQSVAAAAERGRERADGLISSYISKMGADRGLLELARTVRFEDAHVLTREEIVRFGIDRREPAETPWTFENNGRSMVRKFTAQKSDDGKSWRVNQWRLICFNAEQFELDLQREAVAKPALWPSVQISSAGLASSYFTASAIKSPGYDLWGMRINRAAAQALAADPQFNLTETLQGIDGRKISHSTKFSSEGLSAALASLIETCAPPKTSASAQMNGARDSATK